jgi:hypothetical protein
MKILLDVFCFIYRLVPETPWLLKPQPVSNLTSTSSTTSSSAEDEPPAASNQERSTGAGSQYNKVIISINSQPSVRNGKH